MVLVNGIVAYGHGRAVKGYGPMVRRDNVVQRKAHAPCEAAALTIVWKEGQAVGCRIFVGEAEATHSQLVLHEIKKAERLLLSLTFGTVAL